MRSYIKYLISEKPRKKPPLVYEADLRRMPPALVNSYFLLDQDEATCAWLAKAKEPSVWRGIAGECLRLFLSRTTANGIANRGGMFVFSSSQLHSLFEVLRPPAGVPAPEDQRVTQMERDSRPPVSFKKLLDIGAGDGDVTLHYKPFAQQIHVTEESVAMRWRLRQKKFVVLPANHPFEANCYDCVSCLNVLDRADKPLSLLRGIHNALRPDGVLVLAVVLPWCPFVESGSGQKIPAELLPMTGGECCKGATFEQSLEKLVGNVLEPCGFKLLRWTKIPYLSEGSPTHEYYRLNDAVMILQAVK